MEFHRADWPTARPQCRRTHTFYLAHPPLPYSSTVSRLSVPEIIKEKNPTAHLHKSPHSAVSFFLHPSYSIPPPSPLMTFPHLHFSSLPYDTVPFPLLPTNLGSRPHKFSYVVSGALLGSAASSPRGSGVCLSTLYPGCRPVGSVELRQGSGHVVWFSSVAGQSQQLKSAGVNFLRFNGLLMIFLLGS